MKNTPTVEQANAALADIEKRRAQLVMGRNEIGRRLELAEQTAGEKYLAGDRSAAKELAELGTETDLIERALVVLDVRERDLLADLKRATAIEKRQLANSKRTELDGLMKKTARFLKELSVLEEVEYGPSILCEQRAGQWLTAMGGYLPAPDFLSTRECVPELGGSNPGTIATPRSYILRREIEQLHIDAEKIERELTDPAPEPPALRMAA